MTIILASLVGLDLTDPTTKGAVHVSTAPTSVGGRVYKPVLDGGIRIRTELGGRIGPAGETQSAPQGGFGSTAAAGLRLSGLKLYRRDAAGNDRIPEIEDYHWPGGEVWVSEICGPDEYGPDQELVGTITISGTTVTGTATKFLTQLPPDSLLIVEGQWRTTGTPTSDLATTITATHPGATDAEGRCRPKWSHAWPRIWAHGSIPAESGQSSPVTIGPDEVTITVIPASPVTDQPLLAKYAGWREAAFFNGGYATGPVKDPGPIGTTGDFSFVFRAFIMDEHKAETSRYYADNADIRLFFSANEIKASVVTTGGGGGTFTADSGTLLSEAWYVVIATYDESATELKIYIGGVLADTVSTGGTLPASANAWVFGEVHTTESGSVLTGLLQGVALFSEVLTASKIADYSGSPLAGDEDDLLFWYPGIMDTSGTPDLWLDGAEGNRDAPLDATITSTVTQTTAMEGSEGTPIPRGWGSIEHAPAVQVDRFNFIHRLDGYPIETVLAVDEAAERKTLGTLANTMKALLIATVTAGQVDYCPLHALVKLASAPKVGEVGADYRGGSTGERSLFFDGTLTEADFSTGANAALASDFTVLFRLAFNPAVDDQVILSNQDADFVGNNGLSFRYRTEPAIGSAFQVIYRSDPVAFFTTNVQIAANPLRTYAIAVILRDHTTADEQIEVYIDGVLADTTPSILGTSAGNASTDRFRVGFPEDVSLNTMDGAVSDLAIFSETLSLAEISAYQWVDKTGLANLAHYWPAHRSAVAGDFFPATTLVDEAGSADGTLTSPEWRGDLTPTNTAALFEVVARSTLTLGTNALDLAAGIEGMPEDPQHFRAELETTTIGTALRLIIDGVNGWMRWTGPVPSVGSGTASVTAGTAALTVASGDLAGEASLPALVLLEGEAIPLTAIASASAGTLAWTHTGGASADAFVLFQPQLKLGILTDPDAASADVTLPAVTTDGEALSPGLLEFSPRLYAPRPAAAYVATGWIYLVAEAITVTSPDDATLRRIERWQVDRRYARATNTNVDFGPLKTPDHYVRTARFTETDVLAAEADTLRGARRQARVELELYGVDRWDARNPPTLVRDPAGLLAPGLVLELTHPDVGADQRFAVAFVDRPLGDPGSAVIAGLWGALTS